MMTKNVYPEYLVEDKVLIIDDVQIIELLELKCRLVAMKLHIEKAIAFTELDNAELLAKLEGIKQSTSEAVDELSKQLPID